MALIQKTINVNSSLTAEQLQELEEAAKRPVVPDDDCPEITEDEFMKFAEIARQRREERRKTLVSIRLTPETFEKAKKLGKGYTGVLSRLLDMALNNPEMVRKCL